MRCPEVEDGGSSDKPNPFTHSCNDLYEFRLKNPNRLIFAHININSLKKKFEMLQEVLRNSIDLLVISETKLDASFPSSHFIRDGFTLPYRLDRTQHRGGIILFIREDIPSNIGMLRGGSRTAATSKMKNFVIIVNGWKPLTIISQRAPSWTLLQF